MTDYDAEIEKLRQRIARTQRHMREWGPLRWKEQDPEKERIAAERQERERQQRDALNLASIEHDLRMIEILQRERAREAQQARRGGRTVGYAAEVYRVLIASPGDMAEERQAIPEVIHAWNAVNSAAFGVVLLPVLWETHSAPEMGDRPQAIINKQLVSDCDMLIGVFWTRIGSPTGVAASGTVEEIEQLRAAGKPVLLYFSDAPAPPSKIDRDQYAQLIEFRDRCRKEGLVEQYSSVGELREKVSRQLMQTVRRMREASGDAVPVQAKEEREAQPSLAMIREQLHPVLRRYEVEWSAERDSEPRKLDEGKRILHRLGSDLLEFVPVLEGKADETAMATLNGAIKETRTLQQHQVFIDGGASYAYFWRSGDSIIQRLTELVRTMQ